MSNLKPLYVHYKEIIDELYGDIEEALITEESELLVVRNDSPVIGGTYIPIIDWHIKSELEFWKNAVKNPDIDPKIKKELETFIKEYQNDIKNGNVEEMVAKDLIDEIEDIMLIMGTNNKEENSMKA